MKLKRCRMEWEPRDCWVGVYWRTTQLSYNRLKVGVVLEIWICFLPCLPIHLSFLKD